jgi:hypothetical protein
MLWLAGGLFPQPAEDVHSVLRRNEIGVVGQVERLHAELEGLRFGELEPV